MIRLSGCGCHPTAYSGGSREMVHGPGCAKAERPLTKAEWFEWRTLIRAEARETRERAAAYVPPTQADADAIRAQWAREDEFTADGTYECKRDAAYLEEVVEP